LGGELFPGSPHEESAGLFEIETAFQRIEDMIHDHLMVIVAKVFEPGEISCG
jgi:hypothetical protein